MTKEYYQLHKAEIAKKKRIYQQTEAYKTSHALVEKRYSQTDKAKAKRARYYATDKWQDTWKKHDKKRSSTPHRIEQVRAHKAVAYAIKTGRIVKCPCSVCGDDKSFAHHHKGYATENIFNVVWLCRKHHNEAHKG